MTELELKEDPRLKASQGGAQGQCGRGNKRGETGRESFGSQGSQKESYTETLTLQCATEDSLHIRLLHQTSHVYACLDVGLCFGESRRVVQQADKVDRDDPNGNETDRKALV